MSDNLPPELRDLIGKTVNGHRIDSCLGGGGMGAVFKGWDESLQRPVAVKVTRPDALRQDPTLAARFEREALSLSQLNHPNCITIYQYFAHDEKTFLVMELLGGEDLSSLIGDPWRPTDFVILAVQILRGLRHAHDSGVIHRDIKPDNIIVTTHPKDGRRTAKIIDFGIAKLLRGSKMTTLTQQGTAFGTPEYMSPEQAKGLAVDPRSDLYSAGVMFHEILSGVRPFVSDDPFAILRMHIFQTPPPLPKWVPDELARVIDRMIAKEPAARYQSSDEILSFFEELSPESIEAMEVEFLWSRAEFLSENNQPEDALTLYRDAARRGHIGSMERLGWYYATGHVVSQDIKSAKDWYERAAKKGSAQARHDLAHILTDQGDLKGAFMLFCVAAERRHPQSMWECAKRFRAGQGVDQDWDLAFSWCLRAAETGVIEAMYEVGHHYVGRIPGTKKNLDEAFRWFERAAEHGHSDATLSVGYLRTHSGDDREAYKWFQRAAAAGNADAMVRVGELLETGRSGKPIDRKKAMDWYARSADGGCADGMYRLGKCHEPTDVTLWFKWCLLAAKNGSTDGMYEIGIAYLEGKGTEKNDALAEDWLRQASKRSHHPGMKRLARFLREEAVFWEERLRALGDSKESADAIDVAAEITKTLKTSAVGDSSLFGRKVREILKNFGFKNSLL